MGIEMKRKDLTKIFMMILNLQNFGLHVLYKNITALYIAVKHGGMNPQKPKSRHFDFEKYKFLHYDFVGGSLVLRLTTSILYCENITVYKYHSIKIVRL